MSFHQISVSSAFPAVDGRRPVTCVVGDAIGLAPPVTSESVISVSAMTVPSGSAVTASAANTASPQGFTTDVAGTYAITLTQTASGRTAVVIVIAYAASVLTTLLGSGSGVRTEDQARAILQNMPTVANGLALPNVNLPQYGG